jgi:hypothetical protein
VSNGELLRTWQYLVLYKFKQVIDTGQETITSISKKSGIRKPQLEMIFDNTFNMEIRPIIYEAFIQLADYLEVGIDAQQFKENQDVSEK